MTYPPPTGSLLSPSQRDAVQRLKTFLIQNEFDQKRINPHLADLVGEMTAVCTSPEDQGRLMEELDRVVRWQPLHGYWLTYLFQLSMQQSGARYFLGAARLYAEAQINLNEDLSLSSLENAYNASRQVLSIDNDEQLRTVPQDFHKRMRLVHKYYGWLYTSRSYREINPLTEHLYWQKTLIDMKMAFPELDKAPTQCVPEDYLRVIDRCSNMQDIYCRIVARRFLGSVYEGRGELDAALEQFRLGLEEAQSVSLDTEIGHFYRLYGHAFAQIGRLQEAAQQFDGALDHESHPLFGYWRALSLRELGDVRLKMAFREGQVAHKAKEIEHALRAYKDGRSTFENHVGAGVVPVARAVKQQLFRSYSDNALQAASVRQNEQETLAELEAAGPRNATDLVAESKAASELPLDVQVRFRQARTVFLQDLLAFSEDGLDQDFSKYISSVEGNRDERLLYMKTRVRLTAPVTHAQRSDEIAHKILALRLPNVVFLVFHVGRKQTFGMLLDVGSGQMVLGVTRLGERHLREQHEAYQKAVQEVKGLPDPAVGMRPALDDLLSFYESSLAALLEPFLPLLEGRHLKIFPRLFMNQVPLHALTIGGRRLIERCDVSYAPTLGLFLQVHQGEAPPLDTTLAMICDVEGAPSYQGTAKLLNDTYGNDLRVLPNPSWQEFVSSISDGRPTDVFFACHGQYDPDNPAASRLLFRESEKVPFSKILSELDLTACKCVTLGACESGLGRTIVTAEYLGLPIAFFAAGVRYVIGTLWQVNQLSTAILLCHHYNLVRDAHHTVASALNEAQRALMQMRRDQLLAWVEANLPSRAKSWAPVIQRMGDPPFAHPYYWAGFYVAGDV